MSNMLNSGINSLLYVTHESKEDIIGACEKAAHFRLAVPGWVFFELFKQCREGDESSYRIERMSMAYSQIDGNPMGVAVSFEAWGDYNAGCFVRASCRRQGVGKRLVEGLLSGEHRAVRIHNGVVGSMDFWRSVGANEFDYIREKCPVY